MRSLFHKTSTKLAGFYLAIFMAISFFFSVNLYHLSVQEFDRDYNREINLINRVPDFQISPDMRQRFLATRQVQYAEAKGRVLGRLALVNGIILIGGGFLSYYLARRTLRPIEQAHESQSRFTADASHELRTPIAAMRSEIEVALMNPKLTLAQAKNQLTSNLEELEKLTALSEGLLRLAQYDRKDALTEKVDLKSTTNDAVARVEASARLKNIKVTVIKSPKITLQGNKASLIEALVTVLDNAIKYSPEKSSIEVALQTKDKQAIITITDHGIGIKPDELPHIFDRFYRADSARSKQTTKGYGLGLSIAKSIVSAHNGSISATSKPDKGSTFTLSLPLQQKP